MQRDELWNDDEIDPLYTVSLKDLLMCVGGHRRQESEPVLTHAAVPRQTWALLGRPRHLLVYDSCLVVVPSDTLEDEAYFYCEGACH